MQIFFSTKTACFFFGVFLFPIITYAQSASAYDFLKERHLNSRIELGIQSGSFYSNIGLQLLLPTPNSSFLGHGPYAGAAIAIQSSKTSVRPQIGYQTALYGLIYMGVDFTFALDEPKRAVICRPKLGLTFFNFLGIHYSQGFATASMTSESDFQQVGLYFMIPIKKNI